MTSEQYQQTQDKLIALAKELAQLNLHGFIEKINNAENVGPIVDPTLWIKGQKRLQHIKAIAKCATHIQEELEQLRDIVIQDEISKVNQ